MTGTTQTEVSPNDAKNNTELINDVCEPGDTLRVTLVKDLCGFGKTMEIVSSDGFTVTVKNMDMPTDDNGNRPTFTLIPDMRNPDLIRCSEPYEGCYIQEFKEIRRD